MRLLGIKPSVGIYRVQPRGCDYRANMLTPVRQGAMQIEGSQNATPQFQRNFRHHEAIAGAQHTAIIVLTYTCGGRSPSRVVDTLLTDTTDRKLQRDAGDLTNDVIFFMIHITEY